MASVLIVDDEVPNLIFCSRILSDMGSQVQVASSPAEAQTKMIQQNFDWIFIRQNPTFVSLWKQKRILTNVSMGSIVWLRVPGEPDYNLSDVQTAEMPLRKHWLQDFVGPSGITESERRAAG